MKRLTIFGLLSFHVFAGDLTSILGKPWKADAVKNLLSSNYVEDCSYRVTTDFRSGITTTNRLYVVAHPSQKKTEFGPEWYSYPEHIPHIEIDTVRDSGSNRTEVVTSIEVFNTDYGRDVLPAFAKALEVPDHFLNLTSLGTPTNTTTLTFWLWKRPRIYDENDVSVGNCTENGSIAYAHGLGTVYLYFDKEELYSIRYNLHERQPLFSRTHTNSSAVVDLQFLKFYTPWLLSVETNGLSLSKNRVKQMVERNLSRGERGKPIYDSMLGAGYTLARDQMGWGRPPVTRHRRWYTSKGGETIIVTWVDELTGLHWEQMMGVYIDVVKAGGARNIILPEQVALPETPEECLRRFTCIYAQDSRNGKQLLLCCQEGTFLYEDGRLIEVYYTKKSNSTNGIYNLLFHRF